MQRTTTSLGFIAVVATLGCGSSVTNDDITGTGGSTSSAGSGGATTGAGGASSSSGSTGGSGGVGGLDCPDIACTTACPGAIWPELDGCPLCACAADLELVVDGVPRPVQHLGLSVVASEFIGGIDRWIFDFTWHYDDPLASDDEEIVEGSVRIMKVGPQFEPTDKNVTYFYPLDSGQPLEVLEGEYTLHGIVVLTTPITPGSGFFSIRRVGDTFEGYVSLDYTATSPGTVHAAGPFSAPVP